MVDTPDKEAFSAEKPGVLTNWAFEQKYDTSFRVVNTDTGEHVQAMIDPDANEVRLVPMVAQGSGYSSVQDEGVTHDADAHNAIVATAWELARSIRNGEIGRDDTDFTL